MEYIISILIVSFLSSTVIFGDILSTPEPPSNLQITRTTAVSLTVTWDVSLDDEDLQYFLYYDPDGEHGEVYADAQPYEIDKLIPAFVYTIYMYTRNGSVDSDLTFVMGDTKGLPSSEDQYSITALATGVNVHISFSNPDSVSQVNVNCCIEGLCSFTAEQTHGSMNTSLHVSYPDNRNGLYNVTTYLYDGDTLVQQLQDYLVIYGPQDVSVSESTLDVLLGEDSDTVTCSADCNPSCDFQWDTYPITHGANLTITDAKKSDDREYICTASNEIFDAVRKDYANLKLNVVYGPLSIHFNTSQNISLNRAESIIVSCDADCNPSCIYQWDEGGNVLNISKAGQTDIGIHTCTAQNAHGDDNKTVTITVKGIPDTPPNLRVSSKTAVSLNVTWGVGWDGGDTPEYFISVTTGADNFTKVDPSHTMYAKQGLTYDSGYRIQLYARNKHGNSPITYTDETTKALPSAIGLFKVTKSDTYANALLAFGNADSVTDVEIRCCIPKRDDDSSCNSVFEKTNGFSHVLVNLTYPEGGDGVYDVMVNMFDESILVQELEYYSLSVDSDVSVNNNALISVSVFMVVFAGTSIVLVCVLFRVKRNQSRQGNNHVNANESHQNSSDYETISPQNLADIDVNANESHQNSSTCTYENNTPQNSSDIDDNVTASPRNSSDYENITPQNLADIDVNANESHQNSTTCTYENNTPQNSSDIDDNVTASPRNSADDKVTVRLSLSEIAKLHVCSPDGIEAAIPNLYTAVANRQCIKPNFYNINGTNNSSQENVIADDPQDLSSDISPSDSRNRISNATDHRQLNKEDTDS